MHGRLHSTTPRYSHRIVEVFIPGQPAVNRLTQQIRHAELCVRAMTGIAQVVGDELLQSEARTSISPASDVICDPWNATFSRPLNVT